MNPSAEWLEADGLGGFASGRADGVRTRRYHALLLAATTPPTGRVVLVNGLDAWVEIGGERFAVSSQRYAPDVTHPDGAGRLTSFTREPWPTWTYRLPTGAELTQELVVMRDAPMAVLTWRLTGPAEGATLVVRPFLSGRDTHATHHENPAFAFEPRADGGAVTWRPYAGLPAVVALASGEYRHAPTWYRNFQYDDERARGLDFTEDLASPGEFRMSLGSADAPGGAALLLAAGEEASRHLDAPALACAARIRAAERARRAAFPSPLHRAADDYVVRRGDGRTIVAGYPWFSDWGRDTFIALRGLCIAGGRADDALAILLEWSRHVSEGMLPNYFPEGGQAAEYNSVDASLWYVVAVHELLERRGPGDVRPADREALHAAVDAIVAGYAGGTRFGIRMDDDGLLAAGAPGVQLTWMDARVGDRVVTPRIGKPVEIQALWINALRIAGARVPRWAEAARRAQASFAARFWSEAGGHLHDVVDVDHVPNAVDSAFRPNQILAVGGLPWAALEGERARRVVDAVEARLWTPAGLRSLAPEEPGYVGRYGGGVAERDGAYHQGTVWPWLAGPFVEAWVRVRGDTDAARAEARQRFLLPLLAHYEGAAPGHVSEIADADAPHLPNGCPFQAWSVGEMLRVASGLGGSAARQGSGAEISNVEPGRAPSRRAAECR